MDHSGETLAVGAPGSDGSDGGTGNNDQRGEVRVYRLSGNAWGQLGEGIQGREEYERSGISVALSSDGKVIAIGTESGRARTYYREGADWKSRGGDVTGANMVANVALSGGGDTSLTFGITMALSGYRHFTGERVECLSRTGYQTRICS